MIVKILRILVLFPLLMSCGFKVINENQVRNFDIINVITTGDNRINFLLKKNLKSDKDKFRKSTNILLKDLDLTFEGFQPYSKGSAFLKNN